MPTMHSVGVVAGLAALVVVLSGCSLAHGGPHMRYQEAKQELIRLVEAPLLVVLDGRTPPVEPLAGEDNCNDALGNPIDEVRFGYDYRFDIGLLGDNPERLLAEAERAWREAGLTVTRDNASPDFPAVHAGDERGFALEALVNWVDGAALVGGSGPCVKPQSSP